MSYLKTGLCWILALFFFVAGILHFVEVYSFADIVPPFLPFPKLIVWVTGLMEMFFAVGLLIPRYRKLSGFWLAPFLLAVLPANIYMAMYNIPMGESVASSTTLWIRVALQFPLIALILWASGNLDRSKAKS